MKHCCHGCHGTGWIEVGESDYTPPDYVYVYPPVVWPPIVWYAVDKTPAIETQKPYGIERLILSDGTANLPGASALIDEHFWELF